MRCHISMLFMYLFAATVCGEDEFAAAVKIEAGGQPIDTGGYRGASPCFADFDGDGLHDLLVGGDERGRLRIYRNVGTKTKPQFDAFDWFRADGEIAELPVGGPFQPQLVDLDGDGRADVVSPSWTGIVFLYRRRNDGEFAGAEVIRLASGQALNAGQNAACHFADWDGDGDSDLLITGRLDRISRTTPVPLVENDGAARSLSLLAPRPLEAAGQIIKTARSAYPFVADWNGDGKMDLLLASAIRGVSLYENIGETRRPRLAKTRELVFPPSFQGQSSGIFVTDWDQDGRPDILMGEFEWETIGPAETGSVAELSQERKRAAATLSGYRELRELYNRTDTAKRGGGKEVVRQLREKAAQRLKQIHGEIARLEKAAQPRQERHSYVWLWRRIK